LASYAPRVGDTVWVDQVGPDLLVLGTQGLAGTVADPQDVDITTPETSASTSYVNLPTVGPTISTLWLPAATPVLVIVSARCSNASGSGHEAVASYSVSGASTQAAADVDAVTTQSADAVNLSRASVFLTTGTGNHTFQMKYKVINASTGTFANRRLVVWPGH